jgi:hypothetical protein
VANRKAPTNPFYVLLVVFGVVFFVTACAYGLMAFRATAVGAPPAGESGQALMAFLDRFGMLLLAAEVALLAVASLAAMGTDSYWTHRSRRSHKKPEDA